MQIIVRNKNIKTLFNAINKMSIKNMKVNRGRAKLLSKLIKKYEEYSNDEIDILKEYVEVDENDNFVKIGTDLKLKDSSQYKELQSLLDELADEKIVVKGGEYSKRFIDFFEYLLEADDDFTGDEVVVIDDVLEQFEKSKEEKENGI